MYHTILVAFDGTKAGDTALRQAADLAQLCKAELHVLGIVVTAGGLLLDPAVVSNNLLETERRYLLDALADVVRDLGKKGIDAKTCIRDGDAGREIIAYADEIKADLAVIGHSDKGLLSRWIEGSVGTRLLEAMPCNVLITTSGAHLTARH